MDDLIDKYIEEVISSNEYKRLLELKNIIDDKYKIEILNFKTDEDKYQEALKYPKYYDIELLQKNLSNSKSILYNKEEVKEYIELENKIQKKLDDDFNKIKGSISNKFSLKKCAINCK